MFSLSMIRELPLPKKQSSDINMKQLTILIIAVLGASGVGIGADRISPIETGQAVQTESLKSIEDDMAEVKGALNVLTIQNTNGAVERATMQLQIESNSQDIEAALTLLDERTISIFKIEELQEEVNKLKNRN